MVVQVYHYSIAVVSTFNLKSEVYTVWHLRGIFQNHMPVLMYSTCRVLMDGWINGWKDWSIDGWMDRQTNKQMDSFAAGEKIKT